MLKQYFCFEQAVFVMRQFDFRRDVLDLEVGLHFNFENSDNQGMRSMQRAGTYRAGTCSKSDLLFSDRLFIQMLTLLGAFAYFEVDYLTGNSI